MAAILLGGLSCSCSSSGDPSGSSAGGLQGSLDGRSFISETVEGHTLVAGSEVRIGFKGSQLTATAGCNSFSSTYDISGSKLEILGYGITDMGCDQQYLAQDEWLTGLLTGGPTLELAEPRLIMTSADVKMTLLDRELASPDRPLIGTHWVGDGYSDGQAAIFSIAWKDVNASFTQDGHVTIFSGCETGSGSYLANGGSLVFDGFAYDGATCPDTMHEGASNHVKQVIDRSTLAFEIEETRLSVHQGQNTVYFRAVE